MSIDEIQAEAKRLWAISNNTRPANARWASPDEMAPFFAEARNRVFAMGDRITPTH